MLCFQWDAESRWRTLLIYLILPLTNAFLPLLKAPATTSQLTGTLSRFVHEKCILNLDFRKVMEKSMNPKHVLAM